MLLRGQELVVSDTVVCRPVVVPPEHGRPAAHLDGILTAPGGSRPEGLAEQHLSRRVHLVRLAEN